MPWSRIIPARAGFTSSERYLALVLGDHPRSRGVYKDLLDPEQQYSGSSPLARGLRILRSVSGTHSGIIPARAGFTPRPLV